MKFALTLTLGLLLAHNALGAIPSKENWKVLKPEVRSFKITFSASAAVDSKRKISLTPPVAGRIDEVLFEEGTEVKKGDVLAWMSSSDRAALLDAARAQGPKEVKRWEKSYKPIPILSPMDATIVKLDIVEGQTISRESVLFELSDELIIKANVDETDIAKVKVGQFAEVRVDAFPSRVLSLEVQSIGHQAVVQNNINTYEVKLKGTELPENLRSGMTATVNFVVKSNDQSLTLPTWVAKGVENDKITVYVKKGDQAIKRKIKVGSSDGKRIEVLSNLAADEELVYIPHHLKTKKKGLLGF